MGGRTEAHAGGSDEARTELNRVIGPGLLFLFIVGDMLGGGMLAIGVLLWFINRAFGGTADFDPAGLSG